MEASVATEAAQPTDGVRWLFYKGDIDVPSKAVEIFMRWTNLWKKSLENMQCRAPAMTGPRWFLLLTATRTFWKIQNYCCTMHQQAIWAKVMGLILLWCLWLKSATFVQRQSSAGASSSSWRKVLQNLLSSSFTLTSGGVRYYSAGWIGWERKKQPFGRGAAIQSQKKKVFDMIQHGTKILESSGRGCDFAISDFYCQHLPGCGHQGAVGTDGWTIINEYLCKILHTQNVSVRRMCVLE